LAAGLDPEFAILDEGLAGRLRGQAWASALGGFLEGERSEAVDLVAAWGADRVRSIVGGTYAELRSKGMGLPTLPRPAPAGSNGEDAEGARACTLLGELLERFGREYAALKTRRGAVDFDDLELGARELLDENESVRKTWAERFELMMVDEFQDTNPRQLAILGALDRENLFTVGDELQSIYGFRHADVRLFRARRDKLGERGGSLSLTRNFRGRKPLLDVVNTVFGERFGEGYTPLRAGREGQTALQVDLPPGTSGDGGQAGPNRGVGSDGEPIVELLLTQKRGWDDDEHLATEIAGELPSAPRWRQAEARLLAQRVAELVESGMAQAGDVAVLLRAVGDLEVYERALKDRGLSTLATVGGFWGGQQVGDLLAYLRALANPLDELALYGTLASPLVGVSSDGLALLGGAAKASRRGVWETLRQIGEDPADDGLPTEGLPTEGLPTGRPLAEPLPAVRLSLDSLSPADRALLVGFCARFEAERAAAGRRTISRLIERAVEASGYTERVLRLSWGERRLANVNKLLRVARRYEASEGRNLRGFLDHVAHSREAKGGAEPDAPVADGEADVVRLMSIHAAKGLEFGVVCVGDLGRAQNIGVPDLLVDGDRIGLRLAHIDGSEATATLDFEELCEERRRAQAEEEERILYVAMTRARERLLLSGAVDLGRWPEQKLGAPAISWLGPTLVKDLAESVETLHPPVRELVAGASDAAQVPVSLQLNAPETVGTVLRLDRPRSSVRPRSPASVEGAPENDVYLFAQRAPARARAGTLSYTALSEFERCGYRYYLERELGLPEKRAPTRGGEESRRDGLQARMRGTIVHRLLETQDFARGGVPSGEDVEKAAREQGVRVGPDEREELATLLGGALETELAKRLAGNTRGARREHPFAFELGSEERLVTGVIDLLVREPDGGVLVVDYKSDRVGAEEDLEGVVEREYANQRLVYALAVLADGAEHVEIVHWFLERPGEPIGARYTAADRPELEARVAELAGRMHTRVFLVSEDPHRALCSTCPGRSGLCSWSDSDTLRERVGA
jgi:ATP-dependent helicase/nuclease subunit A